MQAEVTCIHRVIEPLDAAIEPHQNLEFGARRSRQHLRQPIECRKQKTLGASEVFLQQAIAAERAFAARQQRLLVIEALRLQMLGAERASEHLPIRGTGTHHESQRIGVQLFVQGASQPIGAGNEDRQCVQRQHVQAQPGMHVKHQTQAGARARLDRLTERGQRCWRGQVACSGQAQRQKRHCVRGSVFAGGAVAMPDQRAQRAAARHHMPRWSDTLALLGLQLHHGHRRHRRQKMWIEHFRQVLREYRLLGFQLELHARGEKRKSFQQTFDIRVGAVDAAHPEPARHFRIRLRELRTHLAHMLQLTVVVMEQARVHDLAGSGRQIESTGFQVEIGTQIQRQRQRLCPQFGVDDK